MEELFNSNLELRILQLEEENAALKSQLAKCDQSGTMSAQDTALKSASDYLDAILNSTLQSFVLIDKESKVLAFNKRADFYARAVFGKELEVGETIYNYVLPGNAESFKEKFDRAIHGEILSSIEDFKNVAGDIVWFSFSFNPVTQADGTITSIVFNSVNITHQKHFENELIKAKEEAEKANRLKDAFIANMSHEIRTPLHGILGITTLLKKIFCKYITDKEERLFRMIDTSSSRIVRTIDMILNYSLVCAGEFKVHPRIFSVEPSIRSIISEYKRLAIEKKFSFVFENFYSEGIVYADEYVVQQALTHLLDNALRFTEEGFIRLTIEKSNSEKVCLLVQDSGVGISDEFLSHLFEPYMQEETGYNRSAEGLGLGLSLSKRMLTLSGGEINAQSIKGEGTTFTILLNSVPKN